MKTLLASISLLALSACAAGPNYNQPAVLPAAEKAFVGSASTAVAQTEPAADWWRLYRDPVLDRLIADALEANTDIRVAVARLERARAALRGARNDRLPQTNIGASGAYQRVPQRQTLPGFDRENWNVDAGLSVSYEADLFGRVRREIEAACCDVGAAAADADAIRLAVVADTTRAYADATSSAARLEVANRIVELLDQSVRITSGRLDAGRASRLDVIRISTVRDQRKADIPSLQAQRDSALFRLATLTGRAPQELPSEVSARTARLTLDQPIPIGDGRSLIARRPDVRAAERRLAADTARIGVATADLYPRITLGGSIGSTGTGLGDLFGAGPLRWLAGPLLNWAFPNQEPVRARIAAAKADTQASLASFDGTVLRALEETETALSVYSNALQRRAALATARDEAASAARIGRARQREGQIDFLTVLDAERTYADAEADLAEQNARVLAAQVDLFRALAGGWGQTQPTAGAAVAAGSAIPARAAAS